MNLLVKNSLIIFQTGRKVVFNKQVLYTTAIADTKILCFLLILSQILKKSKVKCLIICGLKIKHLIIPKNTMQFEK